MKTAWVETVRAYAEEEDKLLLQVAGFLVVLVLSRNLYRLKYLLYAGAIPFSA
jgi:hypothetical protein